MFRDGVCLGGDTGGHVLSPNGTAYTVEQRLSICGGKIKYGSRTSAEARHESYGKAPFMKPEPLHAYQCPVCHFWHLGHKDRRGRPR